MSQSPFDPNSIFGAMFGIPMGGNGQAGQSGPDGQEGQGAPDQGMPDFGPHKSFKEELNDTLQTIASWSKRALIILAVVALVALAGCYWWFHPSVNIHREEVWFWIILVAIVAIVALLVAAIKHKDRAKLFHRLTALPIAVIAIFFIGIVAGWSIIPGNAARYASVLDVQDGNFAEDIAEADYSSIPVIDKDSAELLGNRAMGSIPEYVSQFEISGIYSQINYQGHPVRVSPLVYADLFKWFINRSQGIPAYVLVDMTTQEAQVVKLEQPILYSESEPLARNIDRYVQLKYPTYMFDEKSFELDEDGTPWWVFPVQKKTVGLFEGTTISRVVLVNACTGETEDYELADCPQWVDRAYPSDLIVEQFNWRGLYSGGWLNSVLGQVGVVRTTPGTDGNLGYNYIAQNDDVYLYSGVSSVTADNSIVGFILANQRTGEATYFSMAGATEQSAMQSAEGQVQNLRYTATFPLLLNIEGQPTYFMALKDGAGLVKKFAMVNIESYQYVAVGDTVAACQQEYVKMLASNGVLTADQAQSAAVAATPGEPAEGTIATMAQAVIDGNSHFYVTLKGDDAVYDFALPGLLSIVTYSVGDDIEFTYTQEEDASVRTVATLGSETVEDDSAAQEGDGAAQADEAQSAEEGADAVQA